jgi:hypothetical protein
MSQVWKVRVSLNLTPKTREPGGRVPLTVLRGKATPWRARNWSRRGFGSSSFGHSAPALVGMYIQIMALEFYPWLGKFPTELTDVTFGPVLRPAGHAVRLVNPQLLFRVILFGAWVAGESGLSLRMYPFHVIFHIISMDEISLTNRTLEGPLVSPPSLVMDKTHVRINTSGAVEHFTTSWTWTWEETGSRMRPLHVITQLLLGLEMKSTLRTLPGLWVWSSHWFLG